MSLCRENKKSERPFIVPVSLLEASHALLPKTSNEDLTQICIMQPKWLANTHHGASIVALSQWQKKKLRVSKSQRTKRK